jgi:pimeloyl-ACP methyl ester carboxylesterase
MSLCEWIKNLLGKQEKPTPVPIKYEVVSFTTSDGNYVQGEWILPDEPNDDAIIYCGGGFSGAVTPDYQGYVRAGFRLLHIDLEGEGSPATSDPNRDIVKLKDAVALLRSKLGVTGNIYLVGVSKGGYAVTLVFGYYPNLFKKMVNYMGPINMYDPPYNWTVWGTDPKHKGMVDDAKAYFAKTKDPYRLAKEGNYASLGDRMLLLYGEKDFVCPYRTMLIPFKKKTDCKGMVFPGLSHNVHRDASAQRIALGWLKK